MPRLFCCLRAFSSVGRAVPLQGTGHRFESCSAHHTQATARSILFLVEQALTSTGCTPANSIEDSKTGGEVGVHREHRFESCSAHIPKSGRFSNATLRTDSTTQNSEVTKGGDVRPLKGTSRPVGRAVLLQITGCAHSTGRGASRTRHQQGASYSPREGVSVAQGGIDPTIRNHLRSFSNIHYYSYSFRLLRGIEARYIC